MSENTPVFIFGSLDTIRGGLTKAVLTRANELVKRFENVIFLTLEFQPRFKEIIKELYSTGKLDEKVKVINFFDDIYFNQKEAAHPRVDIEDKIFEEEYFVFKDEKSLLSSYRYYQNGFYKKYKRYNNKQELMFIDYFDASRTRYQRDEYNELGVKVRSRYMDAYNNKPKFDRYFDSNGECCLSVWISPQTGEDTKVFTFNEKPAEYGAITDLQLTWIEEKINNYSNPVLMSDSRTTDQVVIKAQNKNARKIAVLHNNHYQTPYDNTAKVKKTWNVFFKNLSKFDHIIFLTEEQKNDITERFGYKGSYTVVPHAAIKPGSLEKEQSITHNPYLAVTLARYSSQKRLDEAIKSFKYVVERIPTAEYHIYGFGPLEGELNSLIRELNLTDNVKLKGFSNDAPMIYKEAACSILTSDYEGFGLVLTESLANGTPVVSYDIKYGPNDIIRNGIDGFLVEKGDRKEMANKVIEIMENQQLRSKLSSNAEEVVERFSEANYKNDWINVIK